MGRMVEVEVLEVTVLHNASYGSIWGWWEFRRQI
jgi:hypothetical protein